MHGDEIEGPKNKIISTEIASDVLSVITGKVYYLMYFLFYTYLFDRKTRNDNRDNEINYGHIFVLI